MAEHSTAPSTVAIYTTMWKQWTNYCETRGHVTALSAPLPVLTDFLVSSALRDAQAKLSFSNTKLRLAAISYFHRLSGSENPCNHPTIQNVKSAARRRLGQPNMSKFAITRDHIVTMERLFANLSIGTHGVPTSVNDFVFTCIFALMFDGCLRWDDISSSTYTDVVWGPDSLRLFLTETKTDRERRGQWAYIIVDHLLSPGFRLFLRMLELIFDTWSQAPVAFRRRSFELHDIPLPTDPTLPFDPALPLLPLVAEWHQLTVGNSTAFLPSPRSRIHYNAALTCLKSWSPHLGLEPSVLGAQSLRRGSASDHAGMGLSDIMQLTLGRWRSAPVAAGYIDSTAHVSARIRSLRSRAP